jgi:N-methylhydantoinase B
VMESLSPFRVERTELIAGSGGAGQARGGLGIRRDYRFLGSRCLLGGYLQQTHAETAPWGAEGGEAGRPAAFILNPGTPGEQRLKSKVYGLALGPGDVLRLEGAGGGGWGDPAKRDARRTAQDRAEGLA